MRRHISKSLLALSVFAAPFVLPAVGGGAAFAQDGGCTGPVGEVKLYVDVQGVRASQGLIAVTLYPDIPGKFLAKRGSLYVGRVPAHQGTTRACIYVPRPGTYAVALYHDADGDRHFKRNMLGMPAEAYGFSNNPGTFFGIPSFSSVRVPVHGPETRISVRLKYP
jgi:uncharacterized protein (DUF2141 family)